MKARRNITAMRVEEIDALLGGEAQRLSDQYREMPLDFMDGYGNYTPPIKSEDGYCDWAERKEE